MLNLKLSDNKKIDLIPLNQKNKIPPLHLTTTINKSNQREIKTEKSKREYIQNKRSNLLFSFDSNYHSIGRGFIFKDFSASTKSQPKIVISSPKRSSISSFKGFESKNNNNFNKPVKKKTNFLSIGNARKIKDSIILTQTEKKFKKPINFFTPRDNLKTNEFFIKKNKSIENIANLEENEKFSKLTFYNNKIFKENLKIINRYENNFMSLGKNMINFMAENQKKKWDNYKSSNKINNNNGFITERNEIDDEIIGFYKKINFNFFFKILKKTIIKYFQ